MKFFKLIIGGLVTVAAALMISYWPYNFVPMFETEYALEWVEKDTKMAAVLPGGVLAIHVLPAKEGFQIQSHYDIAAEVPLFWEWRAKDYVKINGTVGLSSYLVWNCFVKKPFDHWHVARVWGIMLREIPGFTSFRTSEAAILAAEFDYFNHVYGIKSPLKFKPEARIHTL